MSHHSRNQTGFTLVELLVSVAIVTAILLVVVLNQSTYTDRAALSNLADEIGLTISQAQTYGIGVREFSPGTSEFNSSYGLALSLLSTGANNAYIYFADRNANMIYDGTWACTLGGASECLGKTNISRGNIIESLCVVRTSGADICNVGRIDVSFARPSTEGQIMFFNSGGQSFVPAGMMGARVRLRSPRGSIKSVVIYRTGQISVQ